MNVLSNYTTNNRHQPRNLYRFPSAGFNNVVAFKAAPMPFEKMFTTRFLYSLVKEGVTCAYTGKILKYGHEKQVNSLNFNVGELANSMGKENFKQKVNMVKGWLDIKK